MSGCGHQCGGCASKGSCGEQQAPRDPNLKHPHNEHSKIHHVIGIVSGKGGVGKSTVTSLISVLFRRQGYKVGILDADITGPSIPKAFGVNHKQPMTDGKNMYPVTSEAGLKIMSINLLLESEDQPVVWRGPILSSVINQFWGEVNWGELDYLFVDMPPGTGDVALTVFQNLPLDGIILVTTPQDLVSMIVKKAVHMAEMMNVPILGLVENMSYFECPDCGSRHAIFGESRLDALAEELHLPILARLPINASITEAIDNGTIDAIPDDELPSFDEWNS